MIHLILETSNFISFCVRELKINGFDINSSIKYLVSVLKTFI